jgi:glycerophosphoryl diester phosphodiesterase
MKKYIIFLILLFLVGCSHTDVNNALEQKIQLIAHRGVKDIAPEHTMPAYKKAIELGADFIEIDLRMTKDGYLVSIHDTTVDRTTDGKGDVNNYTLEELKYLDAGSWFSEEFIGERIPTLDEIFDEFGDSTNYFIETRPTNNQLIMEDKLISLIKEKGLIDNVIIQSFSDESLRKIKSINPTVPLVQLIYPDKMAEVNEFEISGYAIGVGPYAPTINRDFVKRMQEENLKVYVWFDNSNEKEYMPEVISFGVDGVFTDFIENTKEVIAKYQDERQNKNE